ncbi:MAG: polysaccharide deacetylase family protein, partial [Gammaproteobacteria bacterium]|nr:polysaccharide deacetylase family protein [Gammaproteobacteria bacterium]
MSVAQLLKNTAKIPLESIAARIGQHRRWSAEPQLWIMMYHRILPKEDPRAHVEEPGMIVEPATFKMHLQVLKQEFTIIPLIDWVNRKINRLPLPDKACAITFDDGWLDNYEYALPILEQEQVPATLFAVSDMVGSCEEFWPNRVIKLLQQPADRIKSISWLHPLASKNSYDSELSAQAIYSLKDYADDELIKLIELAEIELSVPANKSPVLMNSEQLIAMSDNVLIDIGSHTCHHFRLRESLAIKLQNSEITDSQKHLEEMLDKPVELFCYPNGDYCSNALDQVSKHYKAAVTTQRGVIKHSNSDLYRLSRFGVHQDVSSNRRQLLARI